MVSHHLLLNMYFLLCFCNDNYYEVKIIRSLIFCKHLINIQRCNLVLHLFIIIFPQVAALLDYGYEVSFTLLINI